MTRSVYILLLTLFSYVHAFGQQDVGITSVLSPISGCNVGDPTMSINVVVRNFSPAPISPNQITVRYQIDGGPIVSQLITTFLLGNASFNFTFSQTQNLSACTSWNLKIWTSFPPDTDNTNDTITSTFTNDCTPIPGTFTGPSTVCDGNDYDSITVVGGTFNYGLEWHSQVLPAGFSPTGITTDKIYLNNLTSPTNYQVVYPGGLCPDVTSSTFSVAISPTLNTGTTSADLQFCADNVVGDISLSGFTSTLNDWEQSIDGGTTWTSTGSNSNPFSINSYTDSTLFRALVSSGSCGSDYSDTIHVDIEPVIIPGTISGATNVCEGANSGSLTLTGTSNVVTSEWYSSTDNITFNPTGNFTNSFAYTNLTQTTYYKVISTCNICPNDETPVATITVDPAIDLGTNSPDLNLCSTSISGSVSVSGFTNTLTQWQESTDAGVTWTNIGSNSNPFDISGYTATTHFRAIIESGTCGSDTTTPIIVTIDESIIPGSVSGGTTVCQNANSGSLILSGNANQTGFEWYSSIDNVTFNPTGITTATYSYTNLSQTTYFKVILQSSICPDDKTNVITVNVDPALNLGSTSLDLVLCSSNIVGDISISGATSLVVWEQSDNNGITWSGTGSNATPFDISYLTNSALFRGFISSGTCGSGYSDTISVTIEPSIVPGTISGATTVCEGANAGTLTLTGNSNQIGLEWYTSTNNVIFSPSGITSNTYPYSNITQTTYYKVVLTGNNCPNVETGVVTMFVDPQANAGTPSPDLLLCESNAVGDVSLTGFTSSIANWEISTNGGGSWTTTAFTANPLSINGTSTTTLFRAIVASGDCPSVTSSAITVTIEPDVTPGTIQGTTTVCSGTNSGMLDLVGNANDFGFEWYSSLDNVTFLPTGVTTSSYNYTNVSQTTYYKVILQGNICAGTETPVVSVTIDPALVLGTTSPDLFFCETNISGNVSVTGAVTLFDWEQSNDNGFTWFSTGDNNTSHDISGISSSALFRALISSGSCGSDYTDTITVTVDPSIIPGTITGATSVCETSNSGSLNLSGNQYDFGYEWFTSIDNVNFTGTGFTGPTYSYSGLTGTTYFKVILQGNNCPNVETPVVTISVEPELNLGNISSDLVLCSNNISGGVTLTGAVSLFDWEQSNNNGVTWISTGDNSSTHDISGLTASALFRGLVSSGACGSGYSDTISVTIQPTIVPGSITGTATVCAGSNTGTLTLQGNANDFGYEWFTSIDNVNFTGTGATISTFNYLDLTQTTYFKVVLLGNICSDDETNVITVTVDPALNLGVPSPDLVLCSDNISGVVQLTGANVLQDWEQSNDNGATWLSTGDNNAAHDISGITASALFRAYISSGACGSDYSDTISVTIEDAIISGTISGAATVCAGSNAGSLSLSGNANDIGYEWYTSTDNVNFNPSGITTPTYNYTNLTQTTYFMVLLNGNACSDVQTSVTVITVDAPLNLGVVSQDLVLCESNIAGFVSINGATTLQDWQISYDNGVSWLSTSDNSSSHDISGITASALFRAEISSGVCGSGYSDTVSVTIDELGIPAVITSDFTICIGSNDSAQINILSHNGTIQSWQTSVDGTTWAQNGNTDSTVTIYSLFQTTQFRILTLHGACPSVTSNIITGNTALLPVADAGTDQTVLLGTSTQLNGSGGVFGIWTPPTYLADPNVPNTLCTPDSTTAYAYTVIDANGCTNTDYVVITIDSVETKVPSEDVEVYNILTLNGDGKNDVLIIEGLDKLENNKVLIFNGNGTLIYSMEDYQNDWNGTQNGQPVPDGVYLYAIEVSKITKYRGFITIINGE